MSHSIYSRHRRNYLTGRRKIVTNTLSSLNREWVGKKYTPLQTNLQGRWNWDFSCSSGWQRISLLSLHTRWKPGGDLQKEAGLSSALEHPRTEPVVGRETSVAQSGQRKCSRLQAGRRHRLAEIWDPPKNHLGDSQCWTSPPVRSATRGRSPSPAAISLGCTENTWREEAGPSGSLCHGGRPFPEGQDWHVASAGLRWKHCLPYPALENHFDLSLSPIF